MYGRATWPAWSAGAQWHWWHPRTRWTAWGWWKTREERYGVQDPFTVTERIILILYFLPHCISLSIIWCVHYVLLPGALPGSVTVKREIIEHRKGRADLLRVNNMHSNTHNLRHTSHHTHIFRHTHAHTYTPTLAHNYPTVHPDTHIRYTQIST
jgi:hypothetical protein